MIFFFFMVMVMVPPFGAEIIDLIFGNLPEVEA